MGKTLKYVVKISDSPEGLANASFFLVELDTVLAFWLIETQSKVNDFCAENMFGGPGRSFFGKVELDLPVDLRTFSISYEEGDQWSELLDHAESNLTTEVWRVPDAFEVREDQETRVEAETVYFHTGGPIRLCALPKHCGGELVSVDIPIELLTNIALGIPPAEITNVKQLQ